MPHNGKQWKSTSLKRALWRQGIAKRRTWIGSKHRQPHLREIARPYVHRIADGVRAGIYD